MMFSLFYRRRGTDEIGQYLGPVEDETAGDAEDHARERLGPEADGFEYVVRPKLAPEPVEFRSHATGERVAFQPEEA
jgi:hypothetical protein